MTTRQSHRALRRAFYPVLEANGFKLHRGDDGVLATRDRGRYHDEVSAGVVWRVPRSVEVFMGVGSDSMNKFLADFGTGWALDASNCSCNLGTFEPGANPSRPGGARLRWVFDGSEPIEALLNEIKPLLDSTCKHLESVIDADTHADLIRDHSFSLGRVRPALMVAGALAHAGRYGEATRICLAAMESDEAALAQSLGSVAQQGRPLLQAILDYCVARS